MAAISTLVIAADPIMRRLLKDLVTRTAELRLIAAIEDTTTALARTRDLKPDVIVVDLDLPGSADQHAQPAQQLLRQLSLVTAAPILGLAAAAQPGSLQSVALYEDGATLVIGKPSGVLSLDLIEQRGETILSALRRLAGGTA